MLYYILTYLDLFDDHAKDQLLADLLTLSESMTFKRNCVLIKDSLIISLFGTLKYEKFNILATKLLGELFGILISTPKTENKISKIAKKMAGNIELRLQIVNEGLDKYLYLVKNSWEYAGLIYTSYIIEDCILDNPNDIAAPTSTW